jgi:hypothetical protein
MNDCDRNEIENREERGRGIHPSSFHKSLSTSSSSTSFNSELFFVVVVVVFVFVFVVIVVVVDKCEVVE